MHIRTIAFHFTAILIPTLAIFSASPVRAKVLEVKSMTELRTHLASKQPVGILFYAPWCGACSAMKEPYNRVCELLKRDVLLVKVNVEDERFKDALEQFGIEAVPTLIVKHVGMMDQNQLHTALRCFVKKPNLKPHEEKKAAPTPQKAAAQRGVKKARRP